MNKRPETIGELDLLAYADGLLEADVVHKATVERYLDAHPEAAAYVAEIQAQNREIRDLYGPKLVEPVPDRLLGILQSRPSRRDGRAVKAAIVAGLLVFSAGGGWLLGQHSGSDDESPVLKAFVERAAANHRMVAEGVQPVNGTGDMAQPLAWLGRRIALEIRTPDLSAEGFSLVGKERIGPRGNSAVRLIYRRPDGTALNLFLRPRWEERAAPIERTESSGVTVAYWLDGPLAFALTTDADGAEADRLAAVVHEAAKRAHLNDDLPPMALSHGNEPLNPANLGGSGVPLQAVPAAPVAVEPAPQRSQAN